MALANHSISSRRFGFTLLEVMIAVVVLATGLLAIAALQGSLTRASAEAKVRGRVAAMLTARMDELRRLGYDNAALNPGTSTTTSTTDPCDADATDWIDCPREQSTLGSLSVTQVTHVWSSAKGAASFTVDRVPAAGSGDPEFKRVELTATWSDSAGTTHNLAMTTQFSSLSLRDSLLPPPPGASATSSGPIVREDNPEGAGVIPIALGNGDSSAASNPTPELVGSKQNQQIVGTRFNVLTYTPSGSSAVIQKRFETDVIKCTCQYGAGGTNLGEIYRTAQWPAIWTGERYDLYTPDSATDAPGQQYNSGPKSGVTQSPYCTECCRDHHDSNASGVAKFDPEASSIDANGNGPYQKYNVSGSTLIPAANTTNATYVDSCRIIRVDGLWRTAADMYARQFGLLETETVSGVKAKTGLPTSNATNAYTTYVKDFLKQYDGSTGAAPNNAQSMFDDSTRGLNNPATIPIATPSTSDNRYLHGRGLYVDYLEKPARDYISKLLTARRSQGQCLVGGTDLADCVLPFLPFTTINLTEIAAWTASSSTILDVNSQHVLGTDPTQPSGGRTRGIAVGQASTTATMRTSNSGVAATTAITGATDKLGDESTVSDSQAFDVGGGGSGPGNTGDKFLVSLSGGGLNTRPFYIVGSDTGECTKVSGTLTCTTNSLLPASGSVRLENYWTEDTTTRSASSVLGGIRCTYNGASVTIADQTIAVPTFHNFEVKTATAAGIGATSIQAPVNDGTKSEVTTATFAQIPKNGTVAFTLAEQSGSPVYANLVSCTATQTGKGNNGNPYQYWFASGVWNPASFP